MNNIFTNPIAMDVFCYDIIEAWFEFRKSKGYACDEDAYLDWLDDFNAAMESVFQDYMEDEEDDT